jgi:hypothetical protein
MPHFLNGFWVKFASTDPMFDGAHRSFDGKVVGIFRSAQTDSFGVKTPAHVAVVEPEQGWNLMKIIDGEAKMVQPRVKVTFVAGGPDDDHEPVYVLVPSGEIVERADPKVDAPKNRPGTHVQAD